jgi:threonine aldolase
MRNPAPIDLRSDTVTTPSAAMRAAMAAAQVGDDVYGEDPTVAALEQRAAELLGKPAALLFPSGCMANLTAVLLHAPPGSEVVCEAASHVFNYEQASAARLAGVQLVPVTTRDGMPDLAQLDRAFHPVGAPYRSATKLLTLENTHNLHGGRILPIAALEQVSQYCRSRGVAVHLDGARLFDAALASGVAVQRYARCADTVMCCLSKNLGAPIGSMLAGEQADIAQARQLRKLLGGGMRQAGVIAAAGWIALEPDQIARLTESHQLARQLADGLALLPQLEVAEPVETNIVLVGLRDARQTPQWLAERLRDWGVLCHALGNLTVRLVTHRDLPADTLPRTLAAFRQAVSP